jgi:hypothetical protein
VPDYTAGSTASDNCGSVTLSQTPTAGTLVGYGPHTVTVTATDPSGNTASDQVVFTVNDNTPPTITAPADSSGNADANCQAAVPDYTAGSTAADNCGTATLSQSPAAGTMVGYGPHTVTVTANDGHGNTSSDDVVFTVNDVTPPTITAPADSSAYADANCQAPVPDYRPGTVAADNCGTATLTQSPAPGTMVGYGPHTVTVTANDGHGNTASDDVVFTVNDNTPPVINFNGQTPSMWPPNHAYRTFTTANFISSVSDNCGSVSVNDVYITKVTSDEAEESLTLGDGTTFNDIVIAANCKSVQLRRERVNTGNGRVYTIYFKLVDSHGNVTTGTARVYSPKNQGETPGNDAVQYTVTSSCP